MGGNMWFLVIILFFNQQVFAKNCTIEISKIASCSDCIRCGGFWCSRSAMTQSSRCTEEPVAECLEDTEPALKKQYKELPGRSFSVNYTERILSMNSKYPDVMTITYFTNVDQSIPKVRIMKTTVDDPPVIEPASECNGTQCNMTLITTPSSSANFCQIGRTSEELIIHVTVDGVDDEIVVKYTVPCECDCQKMGKVEKSSMWCNTNGDLACGVCSCHDNWSGEFCQNHACKRKPRGDTDNCRRDGDEVDCSGNGYCDENCDVCVCDKYKYGSQYFDEENYCQDICTTTKDCAECFRNPTESCRNLACEFRLNLTRSQVIEDPSWVICNETVDDCLVQYAVRKTTLYNSFVVLDTCVVTAVEGVVTGGVNVTLPVILGVIALLAATAATAGYLFWKNRDPPLPLTDPQYQNIGAEDCVGENPLYKPPTSQFKNPTYGKW